MNKILLGDIIKVAPQIPSEFVDFFCFSPPYNVGIPYSDWNDLIPMNEYWDFTEKYLRELYRIGKPDSRYCINLPYTINSNGKVIFIMADYHTLMLKIGFKFFGHIDLHEDVPHRKKNTAWGSWLSPSAPYFFNSKECVIVYYKDRWKKDNQGEHDFSVDNKNEFINLVQGVWDYKPQTQKLTEANFSLDIPTNAIKLFTHKNELVMDPFMGSGTTAVACKLLDRQYLGIEISPTYRAVAIQRLSSIDTLKNFM